MTRTQLDQLKVGDKITWKCYNGRSNRGDKYRYIHATFMCFKRKRIQISIRRKDDTYHTPYVEPKNLLVGWTEDHEQLDANLIYDSGTGKCKQCGNLTTHWSEKCGECRQTKCIVCDKSFRPRYKHQSTRICGECNSSLKKKKRTYSDGMDDAYIYC